ncbi:MAG: methyltransferase, partial [Burkholderiaceae bacterium]|nr:methyltransferase [Burkholderiaceae bacterium]
MARWLGQVRAALRTVWEKITRKPELFKSQDLVNLAFGIAQRENPATGTSLDAQGATMQDAEASSFSRSAMKSVEANVARGRQALAKALTERTSVNRAMFRNGMGWVDFVWGDAGVVKADGRTKGGMGIAHILEARQRKDALSEQEAVRFLDDVVRTIAEGREFSRKDIGLSTRAGLEHDDAIVWMTKKQGGNAWVVTGYEKSPGGAAAGRATSAPTHNAASLTREEVGAGDSRSVADSGRNGKSSGQSDILFSRHAPAAASRASTAENLGMGESARALKDSFIQAFEESDAFAPDHEGEGKGGKARDAAANNALTEYDRAKALYFSNAKKTSRTKAQEGVDYFATPEPVGLKMVEWLDARSGEAVLEPSGGHGAIARWFPEKTSKTVIEPSLALRSRLALAMNAQEDRIIPGTFEEHSVVNKYDGIAMNPPFGVGGKTAIEHLAKAATHLREGGRIVALIPVGPMADKRFDKWMYGETERPTKPLYVHPEHGPIYKGDTVSFYDANANSGTFAVDSGARYEDWRRGIDPEYNYFKGAKGTGAIAPVNTITKVAPTGPRTETYNPAADLHLVASITLPQSTFERAGTAVMTRIVVIEKQSDAGSAPANATKSIDLSNAESTEKLFDRLEGLSLPVRAKAQAAEAAPEAAPAKTKAATKNAERNEKARAQTATEGGTVTLGDKTYPIAKYTTNAGKEIIGAWVKTQQQALQFGQRTFQKKPLGWFVRERDFPAGAVSEG